MFFEYVCALVLAVFTFWLLTAIVGIPIAALTVYLNRRGDETERDALPVLVNQVVLSVLLGIVVALVSRLFADHPDVTHSWVYGISGFLFVMFYLSSNAVDKERDARSGLWVSDTQIASVKGARIGAAAAMVAYPLFYFWPAAVTLIPGVTTSLGVLAAVAGWLAGFWVVRVVVFIAAASYLWSVGSMALFGVIAVGMMLWLAIFDRPKESQAEKERAAAAGSDGES